MEKQNYDPAKKYTWTPEDSFSFSGEEFGLIINTIRTILSTPEANQILMAARVNDVLDKVMSNAVESGVAKEMNTEVKPTTTMKISE